MSGERTSKGGFNWPSANSSGQFYQSEVTKMVIAPRTLIARSAMRTCTSGCARLK